MGGVAESLPPQCRGIPVDGLDWSDVEGAQSLRGTTWAETRLVGTFDGQRFILTEPPSRYIQPQPEDRDSSPACDAPEGVDRGPRVPTFAYADFDASGEVVALWVTNPDSPDWDGPFVVNVAVRPGHAASIEAMVRSTYDGHPCVVERDGPTHHELRAILNRLPEMLAPEPMWWGAPDPRRGVVTAGVTVVTDDLQRRVDEEFGAGRVELRGTLRPID
jgi:hypothetical protein